MPCIAKCNTLTWISFKGPLAAMNGYSGNSRRGVHMGQEPVSRNFHRSFHYASARYPLLECSIMRASASNAVIYSLLNSVAYRDFGANPFRHGPGRTQIEGIAKRAQGTARSDACQRAGTDLHATRRPGSTPSPACPAARPATRASEFRRADEQAGAERFPVRSHA